MTVGCYYESKLDELKVVFGARTVSVNSSELIADGRRFPIVDDVIVALPPARMPNVVRNGLNETQPNYSPLVQESFGAQWQRFSEVTREHHSEFHQYFDLVDLDGLSESRVGDFGCGSGRYAVAVAPYCASLVLVDFSEAIFVARENLRGQPHAIFVMADLLDLPFGELAFDFVYSLGVLHHLPAPALSTLRGLRKYSPRFLIYLYYALDNRPAYFRFLLGFADRLRRVLSDVRHPLVQDLAVWMIAALVYLPMSLVGWLLRPFGLDNKVPLSGFYTGKSFRRLRQDAHDRFLTSIEQRVSRSDIRALEDDNWIVEISDGLPYWHFTYESGGVNSAIQGSRAKERSGG